MADNVTLPGTNEVIGADEVGGAKHQRVKPVWGPDGTANDTDVASGKSLPVQVRSATGLVPIGEPTDGKNSATDTTSVSLISAVKQLSHYLSLLVFGAGTEAAAQRVTLPTDGTGKVGLNAGTAYIGQVAWPRQFVTVDFAVQTTALDIGDVVADTQVVTNATRLADEPAKLMSLMLIDVDDQKAILRIVFFSANTSLGTEDSAPDIDDTEVQTVLGYVDIAVADYVDLGANSVVVKNNINMMVLPATGTRNIYAAIYTPATSTPTYAGGHIYVRLGFE